MSRGFAWESTLSNLLLQMYRPPDGVVFIYASSPGNPPSFDGGREGQGVKRKADTSAGNQAKYNVPDYQRKYPY